MAMDIRKPNPSLPHDQPTTVTGHGGGTFGGPMPGYPHAHHSQHWGGGNLSPSGSCSSLSTSGHGGLLMCVRVCIRPSPSHPTPIPTPTPKLGGHYGGSLHGGGSPPSHQGPNPNNANATPSALQEYFCDPARAARVDRRKLLVVL